MAVTSNESHDDYPEDCPNCGSPVEEGLPGVSCSNFRCLWKRWWNDKLDMYSAEIHENSES